MYRNLRTLHKWIGLFACVFLVVISATGFLLAIKKRAEWIQPETLSGDQVAVPHQVVDMHAVFEAVRSEPGFESFSDIDRIDYRPNDNVYKVRSADGLSEVQVDGATGEVLKRSPRNDQLIENIHDMSFFSGALHDWLLPAVAVGLFCLGVTGCVMFFIPIVRRRRFWRDNRALTRRRIYDPWDR